MNERDKDRVFKILVSQDSSSSRAVLVLFLRKRLFEHKSGEEEVQTRLLPAEGAVVLAIHSSPAPFDILFFFSSFLVRRLETISTTGREDTNEYKSSRALSSLDSQEKNRMK